MTHILERSGVELIIPSDRPALDNHLLYGWGVTFGIEEGTIFSF